MSGPSIQPAEARMGGDEGVRVTQVVLEVDRRLGDRISAGDGGDVAALRDWLDGAIEELGLPGRAAVELAEAAEGRAVDVRIHGVLQPYGERILRRAAWPLSDAPEP